MPTREDTRRELRELARLAEVIPKERTTIAPPAFDTAAISGSEPTMVAHSPAGTPAPSSSPLVGSQAFMPSFGATDSIAPAATSTPPAAPTSGLGWRIAAGGGTLAAAMIGGLLLGQALASHPASHAAAAAGASDMHADSPAVVKAPPAPPPAPPETAAPLVVTDEGATAVTVKAPRPAHHAVKKTPKAAPSHETTEESSRKSTSSSAASGGDSNK
jgi:hypothetical protein